MKNSMDMNIYLYREYPTVCRVQHFDINIPLMLAGMRERNEVRIKDEYVRHIQEAYLKCCPANFCQTVNGRNYTENGGH